MIKKLTQTLLILFPLTLSAQGLKYTDAFGTKEIYKTSYTSLPYEKIDGTPYSPEQFESGSIQLTDGSTIDNVLLRYDWFANELEIKIDNKIQIVPNSNKIKSVKISKQVLYPIYNLPEQKGYTILLFSGNTPLFKNLKADFNDEVKPESLTAEYKPPRFTWSKEKYLTILNAQLIELKLRKKGFSEVFPADKQDLIDQFIKSERLSVKDEEDLVKIFKYYNEIK